MTCQLYSLFVGNLDKATTKVVSPLRRYYEALLQCYGERGFALSSTNTVGNNFSLFSDHSLRSLVPSYCVIVRCINLRKFVKDVILFKIKIKMLYLVLLQYCEYIILLPFNAVAHIASSQQDRGYTWSAVFEARSLKLGLFE